jgi:hypothetical protein
MSNYENYELGDLSQGWSPEDGLMPRLDLEGDDGAVMVAYTTEDAELYDQITGLLCKMDVAFTGVVNPKKGCYQIATDEEQVDTLAAVCQGIAVAVEHYRGRTQNPVHQ